MTFFPKTKFLKKQQQNTDRVTRYAATSGGVSSQGFTDEGLALPYALCLMFYAFKYTPSSIYMTGARCSKRASGGALMKALLCLMHSAFGYVESSGSELKAGAIELKYLPHAFLMPYALELLPYALCLML